jgi:hypothetical protein
MKSYDHLVSKLPPSNSFSSRLRFCESRPQVVVVQQANSSPESVLPIAKHDVSLPPTSVIDQELSSSNIRDSLYLEFSSCPRCGRQTDAAPQSRKEVFLHYRHPQIDQTNKSYLNVFNPSARPLSSSVFTASLSKFRVLPHQKQCIQLLLSPYALPLPVFSPSWTSNSQTYLLNRHSTAGAP